MPRLRRTRTSDAGVHRRRRGRAFTYVDPSGEPIRDETELERIRALVIPPAWTDVWIAPQPNAHIQATGLDAAGRRQYLYHPQWRARMDGIKFERMLALAEALLRARRGVTLDLRVEGFGRTKVLAAALRKLDAGSLRVGAERYADEHGSFGLTTLLCAHATVHAAGRIELRFPAKSGQPWHSEIHDADLAAVVSGLKRRGGRARLLAWRDDAGDWHPLRAEEVNHDVRERTGGEFTAKDFRTLRGTAVAALSLARSGPGASESARRRAVQTAVRAAADALGNTPAIARTSYVDPRVIDRYERGETIDPAHSGSVEAQLRTLLAD